MSRCFSNTTGSFYRPVFSLQPSKQPTFESPDKVIIVPTEDVSLGLLFIFLGLHDVDVFQLKSINNNYQFLTVDRWESWSFHICVFYAHLKVQTETQRAKMGDLITDSCDHVLRKTLNMCSSSSSSPCSLLSPPSSSSPSFVCLLMFLFVCLFVCFSLLVV